MGIAFSDTSRVHFSSNTFYAKPCQTGYNDLPYDISNANRYALEASLTGLQQVLDLAFSSQERLDALCKSRSEVGILWNVKLTDDEKIILDALPNEVFMNLSRDKASQIKMEPINLLQAIIAKAASSQEFFDDLLNLKGNICQKYEFPISENDRLLLNSIPNSQLRVMVIAVKSTRPNWLATFGRLSIIGLTILLSFLVIPDSGLKVFGNRPGQTLDDYFQQIKVLGSNVQISKGSKNRRDIINSLENHFGIRIYVSPQIKVPLDEVPSTNSQLLGDLLAEIFSVDRHQIYYANKKIMIE